MALKSYFKGKTGFKLWGNIALMVVVVSAVPVATLLMLDNFTHHGEKIEVPSVIGKLPSDAERMLNDHNLVCTVADSAYDKSAKPGTILDQSPKAGCEVKAGRVVYLTVNLNGEPMVKVPKLDGSLREVEAALVAQGFRLTPHEIVYDRDKDLVIGVKQGAAMLHTGQMASRERMVTIVVGGGVQLDTISDFGGIYDESDTIINDFDIEL